MSIQPKVLFVDDEGEATLSLTRALRSHGLEAEIHAAGNATRALEMAGAHDFDAAVLDLSLNRQDGVESGFRLLAQMVAEYPRCRLIVLTGSASINHGVRALDLGAAHFLEKPVDPSHLVVLLRDSFRQSQLRREFEKLKSERTNSEAWIVGSSPAAQRMRQEVEFAASHNQALLITGETGTGKGLCARVVHLLSARANSRLVRYQPNYANPDLVNSDLFGHARGAFTGAQAERRGLIVEAQGGTLFLDEIDELPGQTQVTLLGVLQDRTFRAVGANADERVDIRLICASNQDLELCVRNGKVRQDFFHRVAHARVHLAPLRERLADVPLLADRILCQLREREQVAVFVIANQALETLMSYSWPGNVRELEGVVEGAAYRAQFSGRHSIEVEDIVLAGQATARASATFSDRVENYKRELIEQALLASQGNQLRAAQALGLDRSTLRRILARSS